MAARPLEHETSGIDPVGAGRSTKPLVLAKSAVGLIGAFVLLFAVSTSALACAGGFLQAVLFHKYPEAKTTTKAIAEARERGTLKGDEWSKSSGKSLHAWRSERTKATIQALQRRLNSAENPPTILVDTNVFLLNEFIWLSVTNDGKRIAVSRRPYGLPMSEPKVFTSRRVLDELLNGGITSQQAIDEGLVTSRCRADCSKDKRYGLLSLVTATPPS